MADVSAGDAKLIQYLNEAYGLEQRLETALQAHIGIAERAAYKRRLREHLTETKRHSREVAKRIKRLGGSAEAIDVPAPEPVSGVARVAVAGAQRAAALAQGPLHALRGTGGEERQLKNAKTEYASEAEEIATYTAVLALAQELGDSETATLAKAILREEERMRGFLEKEIPRLVRAVAKAEVPSAERGGARRRSGSSRRARASGSAGSKATGASGASRRASSVSGKASAATRKASAKTARAGGKATTSARKSQSALASKASATTRKAGSAARKARAVSRNPATRTRSAGVNGAGSGRSGGSSLARAMTVGKG